MAKSPKQAPSPPQHKSAKERVQSSIASGRASRSAGKRFHIDPTTCEVEYTDAEFEFQKAVERYKRTRRRPFPTLREILEIAHSLGYRKVEPAGELPGGKGAK